MPAVLLAMAACRGEPAPAGDLRAEPATEPAAEVRAPDDAPLPAVDEVPSFLKERAPPLAEPAAPRAEPEAAAPPAVEPTLAELVKQVQPGDDGGEPFAFVDTEGEAPPQEADPCADVKAAIAKQEDFLRRTGAERDRYGYIEDGADASALRLLESLRRCEEHPDDPDCTAAPLERDVSELEAEPHTVERDPDDLDATDHPEAVVNDPALVALHRKLVACEAKLVAQPLLQR